MPALELSISAAFLVLARNAQEDASRQLRLSASIDPLRTATRSGDLDCRLGSEATVSMTVSVGVAHLASAEVPKGFRHGSTEGIALVEQLYRNADQALYRAKRSGRDRVSSALENAGAAPV